MPAKKTAAKSTARKHKTTTTKKKTTTTKKKAASTKSRPAAKKKKSAKTGDKSAKTGDKEVKIDRRRNSDRRQDESDHGSELVAPQLERREKVQRRRQIDPTTCERDYSALEIEFMSSMDDYKRKSGRMFPTCSEVLEVIRDLGYVKLTPVELATLRPAASVRPATAENAPSDVTAEQVVTPVLELACADAAAI